VKIVLYGRLADSLGRELRMDVGDSCTISSVKERIIRDQPVAAETLKRSSRAVVGGLLVSDDQVVGGEETIEFLPPLSGG
jgi:molybdopterin converting factor small subunit